MSGENGTTAGGSRQHNAKAAAALWREPIWSDEAVAASGLAISDAPLVSVGGGLGSFALVDFLRIAGAVPENVRVLAPFERPEETYRYLLAASQIAEEDPLRSDSMSRIDNIWGWPGYALQEAVRRRSLGPLWRVLTEPILSEPFSPRPREVFAGLEREARRIDWPSMVARGQVRVVRRRRQGGYFALCDPLPGHATSPAVWRARYVHIAVGYPALRFLPDLQAHRERFGDVHRFANAYEPHEHVYKRLLEGPGSVLVRGGGITASRILQRLIDDRDRHGARTDIFHLLRPELPGSSNPSPLRRPGGAGVRHQSYTFVKAAGGGQARNKVLSLEGEERAAFIKKIGGSTTPRRRLWQRQLSRGRREGWYRIEVAQLRDVALNPEGRISATLERPDGARTPLAVDFVIDATGLEGDIREHGLLSDLLTHGGAATNPLGRLDVDPCFEVRGTRSGDGRIYASGPITLGGYLAPVDSFWGLEHAALEICDDLARQGFCTRIGVRGSIVGWWRWARNTPP